MASTGIWEGEYGSRMTLSPANPNLIFDNCESAAVASGEYRVVGWRGAIRHHLGNVSGLTS